MTHFSFLFPVMQYVITLKILVDIGMETGHPGLDMFKNEGSTCTSGGGQSQVVKGSHCLSMKQKEGYVHAADSWREPAGDQPSRRCCGIEAKLEPVHHTNDCCHFLLCTFTVCQAWIQ